MNQRIKQFNQRMRNQIIVKDTDWGLTIALNTFEEATVFINTLLAITK